MSCIQAQTETACSVTVRPSICNMTMQRGTDNTFEVILTDGVDPVNITSDDVILTVRDNFAGVLKLQKTNVGGSHLDGPNGKTEFTIDKEDIDDEAEETDLTFWVYEVRRIQAGSGEERVHLTGQFIIEPTVTA